MNASPGNKNQAASILGAIVLVAMVAANVMQIPWTLNMILEQIATGWGYGTNMELAMLYPWMAEILSFPAAVLTVFVLCFPAIRPTERPIRVAAVILLALAAVQTVLTNLFAFF